MLRSTVSAVRLGIANDSTADNGPVQGSDDVLGKVLQGIALNP